MDMIAQQNDQGIVVPTLIKNRLRILLVEDSKLFSQVLKFRFEAELGVDVTHCGSLKSMKAVAAGKDHGYTLAVVDLNLPDSPHREALDYALQVNLPTIVFTGTFDFNTRDSILEKNVLDYVIKDNDQAFDTIVNTVKRVIDNRNIRVLVVDDSRVARAILKAMLSAQQFRVEEAASGREALAKLQEFPDIELILTDYNMPDMDGYEMTRKIRRTRSGDTLKIIGLSSSSDPHLSASFLKAGASDFLYRPFVQEEFQCRIAHNIESLAQLKRLRALASRDYLTDMYNRRHFYDRGTVMVKHAMERHETCCAVILDIDHFKKFNDTHGHETGDLVLKAVAKRLTRLVSDQHHLTARIGGEEFAILFMNVDVKAATEMSEAIRLAIENTMIVSGDNELNVTVSMGVAEIVEDESFANYLNAADQYLFMAKSSGRNCVFSDHTINMQIEKSKAEKKSA